MNSREIATKLFRYAAFVRAEAERRRTIDEITGEDYYSRLEDEAQEAQVIANWLHDLKENIG